MDPDHLIAHRGWQRRYPENTLPALEAAIQRGARHLEVDVQLTADAEPVLFHDRTLRRICRQSGAIHHYAYAQIQTFSAFEPERFDDEFAGTPIPHLSALVTLLERYPKVHLFLEIKRIAVLQFGNEAVFEAIAPWLGRIATRCTLISFSFEFLQYAASRGANALGPVLNTWEEIESPTLAALKPAVIFCDKLQIPHDCVVSQLPYALAVYEVDDAAEAAALFARGVRFVETFAVGELLEASA